MPAFTSPLPSVPPFKEGIVQTLFRQRDANDNLDRPCYIDALTDQTLTFADVRDRSLRFGAGLQDVLGFQKGDVLAICAPNVIDYAVVLFGTLAAGGAVSPANPNYTEREIEHQLRETQAKVLVVHPFAVKSAVAAANQVESVQHIFVFGNQAVGDLQPYSTVLLDGSRRAEPVPAKADDLAYLCFSSGTTGKSKGVMTSHDNVVTNIHQFLSVESTYFSPENRQIAVLPFFHIYALTLLLHATFYTRTPIHILPRFDLLNFLKTIQRYRITFACVVPPILVLLAKNPDVQAFDLSSLQAIVSGAAPLSTELMHAVLKRFPNLYIKQAYGLTETSPVVCVQPNNQIVEGASGVLVPDSYNKIVDEDGKELGIGERGELWVKGRHIMQGYLNRPEDTANSIDADGYFHTGDVAIIDKDGNLYIVDRLKELIKYKGFQVAPAELEGILLKHPHVADCAVIGVYDEEQVTEIPRAYVVLNPGIERSTKTAESLQKFVSEKVASFKQIRSVVFRDEIPKSATGKILRKVLRGEVKQEAKFSRAKL